MNTQNTEFFTQIQAGLHFDLSKNFGVIRASGEDARTFLHSQFTQDINHLNETEARLAAYCSAKGRMFAIFYVWADAQSVYLLCERSVLATVLKRLRMFVLRAKVVLEDVSEQYALSGYAGTDALSNNTKMSENQQVRFGIAPASFIAWQQPNLTREIRIIPIAEKPTCEYTDYSLWQWLDIMAGIAHVSADISESFVPQMMNLDRIGGVNFKKGCYPGQEIVARSHYLGKLKRRMQSAYTFNSTTPAFTIGMDIYSSVDSSQPAGQLLAFAPNPVVTERWDILYEVSLPMLENDARLHTQDDETEWQASVLPYTLADQ